MRTGPMASGGIRPILTGALARHACALLVLWALTTALVFGTYELLEGAISPSAVDLAKLVRGAAAALLATLATAAYMLTFVVPSLEGSLVRDPSPGTGFRDGLAGWLLGLRWVAILGASAAIATACYVTGHVDGSAGPYLWTGVAALVTFNGVLSIAGTRRLSSQGALGVQVAGDVVVLAYLLYYVGGIRNPFAGFFAFHAVIASIVLEPRTARRTALAIAALVALLTALECLGIGPGQAVRGIPTPGDVSVIAATGGAVTVVTFGCAVFAGGLVSVIRREKEGLAQASAALAAHVATLQVVQDQMRKERENLQTIIDCMADAVLYVDPNGRIRLHNRAARALWPEASATPETIEVCHTPDEWRRIVERMRGASEVEAHPLIELHGHTFEANFARVPSADGGLLGMIMVARDVTERIEAQKWRMQEVRMATVGKLAAALAHELNNPLGAIALFSQHALAGLKPGHALHDHLGTVLKNANLCKKIVRDLLEYARQRPPERRELRLDELLRDVGRTLDLRAQASGVSILLEGIDGDEPTVFGDRDQLCQVLVNLGLNAIEAMPGGGTLTIRATPRSSGGAHLEVIDTGVGIPPEEREKIFSAFHTTKPEGTGLGLAVAKDIVTAHGGSIGFRSQPDRGTTFVIDLPGRSTPRMTEVAG